MLYKIIVYCFCPKIIYKRVIKQKLYCCTKLAKVTPQLKKNSLKQVKIC